MWFYSKFGILEQVTWRHGLFDVHLLLHIIPFLALDMFHHGAVTKTMSTPLDTFRFVTAHPLVLVYIV